LVGLVLCTLSAWAFMVREALSGPPVSEPSLFLFSYGSLQYVK
jgi:hypothetical protein